MSNASTPNPVPAADARQEAQKQSRPLPPKRNRALNWLRYKSWTWIAGIALICLGLLNIYPFLWMLGTSVKTKTEASRHRESPWPGLKYQLTAVDRFNLSTRIESSDDQAGVLIVASIPPDLREAAKEAEFVKVTVRGESVNGSTLSRSSLVLTDTPPPGMAKPTVTESGELVFDTNRQDLAVHLVRKPEGDSLAVRIAPADKSLNAPESVRIGDAGIEVELQIIDAVPMDLLMRQIDVVMQLRADTRRREDAAKVPPRISPDAYSTKYSANIEDTHRELNQLVELGWLVKAPAIREYWFAAGDEKIDSATLSGPTSIVITQLAAHRSKHPDQPPRRISLESIAREHKLSLIEARDMMQPLVNQGLLKQSDPKEAYMLQGPDRKDLRDGLNARQLKLLRQLYDEDEKLLKGEQMFIAARLTTEEYADSSGLYIEYEVRKLNLAAAVKEIEAVRSLMKKAADKGAKVYTNAKLNERQEQLLQETLDDGRDEPRISPLNYAMRFELFEDAKERDYDIDKADEELTQLADRGLLASDRLLIVNYQKVLQDMKFWVKILTSLVLTAGVVVMMITISSMLGYALARLTFPGKFLVLTLMIAGSIAPQEAIIIPIFRMLQPTGAFEGLWGMVLWLSMGGVGNSLLMAGFFLTLPKAVEEAAKVDGAGPFRTFFDIALPMARPIVMTVGLFAFIGAWNNFLIPFITTQAKPNMQPLAVAVYSFQQGYTGFWHWTNAAAAIMIIPVIILFLLLQKHIVKSIAVGAIKG